MKNGLTFYFGFKVSLNLGTRILSKLVAYSVKLSLFFEGRMPIQDIRNSFGGFYLHLIINFCFKSANFTDFQYQVIEV